MKKLMDRNFKWWTESSPMNFALYQFYNTYFTQKMQSLPPSSQEYRKLEDQRNPYSLFGHPHLSWPSEVFKPDEDSYHGKLIILVDRFVGSASEDFVVSFKNNHRATLIGETTVGSTGQPFIQEFSNGINVYIGMKRAYFPDGSEFEGVGIQPDIKVTLTPQDHANPQDKILNIALDHISHK
jgi:carboxyl-terminal processing protease